MCAARRSLLPRLTPGKAEELFKTLNEEGYKQNKAGGSLTSTNVANLAANRPLNRWHNVLPADGTRVVLNPTFKNSDYINANHVVVPEAKRAYILTQGPLPETIGHFWNMVWQQKSEAIIMLCKTVEGNLCKCAHYWPRNSSPIMGTSAEPIKFKENGGLEIRLLETTEEAASDTRIRVMELTSGAEIENNDDDGKSQQKQKRIVTQYHFQTWPDFGVPSTPDTFLSFLRLVASKHPSTVDKPNVVHCSAGIGRSGTFCLVDSCLEKMALTNAPMSQEEVLSLLLKMRRQRDGQVQTPDQLRFAFAAISDALADINFSAPAADAASLPRTTNLIEVSSCDKSDVTSSSKPDSCGASSPNGTAAASADNDHEKNGDLTTDVKNATTNGVSVSKLTPSSSVSGLSRKRSTDISAGGGGESLMGEEVAAKVAAATASATAAAESETADQLSRSSSLKNSESNLAKRKRDC